MGCKALERKLASIFQWYGQLVGQRPLPFLIAPLLLTILMTPGLLKLKYDDDVIMLFTPYKAPSRREQVIAREFARTAMIGQNSSVNKNLSDSNLPMIADTPYTDIWYNLQISTEGNLMTQETWTIISNYVKTIYDNFTCQVDDWVDEKGPHRGSYDSNDEKGPHKGPYTLQYRRDFCNPNRGCVQIDTLISRVRELLNSTKFGNNPKVRLNYPVMQAWDETFNWGQYIFGVTYDPVTKRLLTAKILNLYFQFQVNTANSKLVHSAQTCIRKLTQHTSNFNQELNRNRSVPIHFLPLNEFYVADEVSRIREYLVPYLAASILFIFLFIAITSFKRQFALISILGSGMGLLTVGLSLLASTGFLCLCGVHVNFVVMVVPFLVLCVGIDNDFLITSAWRQTADTHSGWRQPADIRSTVKHRLGRAFADCGPSLTITSVNDILCFGVGYLSETPAVADFCLHTCIALVFRFLFQLTFFAAITAYIGRKEGLIDQRSIDQRPIDNRQLSIFGLPDIIASANTFSKKSPASLTIDFSIPSSQLPCPQSPVPQTPMTFCDKVEKRLHAFFGTYYVEFLMLKPVRLITAILYITYFILAVTGAAHWKIDISIRKLFFDDSPLQTFSHYSENYIFREAVIGRVYVNSPPDFRYKANRSRFFQFVTDLENIHLPYSNRNLSRKDTTELWLRQYTDFLQFSMPLDSDDNEEYETDFYDYLPDFLHMSETRRYFNDLRFKREPDDDSKIPKLNKFRFVISYFWDLIHPYTFDDQVQIMLRWREVCKNYSDYQAIVFDHFNMNAYYDQRLTLSSTCLQTMGIALLSMSAVTALLMPDIRSMFFICLSFLSVDVGVIGTLNVWKSDLDPISLAFVLMTVGFSVYYTARVCYCYQSVDRSMSSKEKMRYTMQTVGWPIFQGAMATVLGILPTVLLRSYMIRVFYRTVILVVVIGLAHGLLFMPILMSAFDTVSSPLNQLREYTKKRQRRGTNDSGGGQSADTLSVYSVE